MSAVLLDWLDTEPRMLTRERVHEITSLSLRTIDRRLADGTLMPVQLGRRRMVERESLRAFLAAGMAQ